MLVYFGDLHIKETEPHRIASLNFLKWLRDKYKNEIVISGGDLFDSSSVHHTLVSEVIDILKEFTDFRIISGNHDTSKRMGNILEPLSKFSNIIIYTNQIKIRLNNINFLILPHTYSSNKDYENIVNEEIISDYSLSHITPIQESFGDEGVELKFKVNVAHIFAHIHRYREFKDNFGNNVLIAGSVISTKQGEQEWDKYIYILEKDKYNKIPVPQYFTYETIEYGKEPTDKNNIINVINAPSVASVIDKYKGYYIREEGIQIKSLSQNNEEYQEIDSTSLIDKFKVFALDNNIDEDLKNECLKYLKRD